MLIQNLGTLRYRDAWAIQEQAHADVLAGGEDRLLLVEHPPVITFGRRGVTPHLLASQPQLDQLGVELVESDRGGDVTFHGPGQLVAYPIVRLATHGLSVSAYVHTLERLIIQTLADYGVQAHTDPTAVGVWVDPAPHAGAERSAAPDSSQLATDNSQPATAAKIAAIGVRIRRGVSLHGLALNVSTDLRFFNLIVPCGLADRPVTSLAQILGPACPPLADVQSRLTRHFLPTFTRPAVTYPTD
jgi:lipoate-protein ligase B